MIIFFDKELTRVLEEVKLEVAKKLGVKEVSFCLATYPNHDKLTEIELCFYDEAVDSYAGLYTKIFEHNSLSHVLHNFVSNEKVKWYKNGELL